MKSKQRRSQLARVFFFNQEDLDCNRRYKLSSSQHLKLILGCLGWTFLLTLTITFILIELESMISNVTEFLFGIGAVIVVGILLVQVSNIQNRILDLRTLAVGQLEGRVTIELTDYLNINHQANAFAHIQNQRFFLWGWQANAINENVTYRVYYTLYGRKILSLEQVDDYFESDVVVPELQSLPIGNEDVY